MKRTVLALAILSVPVLAQAQDQSKFLLDFQTGRPYAALYKPVGKLTGLFGSGFAADAGMFAATDFAGRPLFGYALQTSWKVADQLTLTLGPSLLYQSDEKPRLGILAGFSYKF